MDTNDTDHSRCTEKCYRQFLETVSADFNETFSSVCTKLTTKGPNQNFWPLYWCDSKCTIWNGVVGLDPKVNLIINQCNDIGQHSVFDPGPPPPDYTPPTYTCGTDTNKGDGSVGLCTNIQLPALATPAAAGTEKTSTSESTILATQSGMPTIATTSSSSPVAAETPPWAPVPTSDNSQVVGLATHARIAIILSSVIGGLFLLCLTLFLFRRRRKARSSTLPSSLKYHIRYPHDFPPLGSPTHPLIPSPTTTRPPLTPPLRLRDRRFLPSILRQSRDSPSPPLTPLDPLHLQSAGVFPSSPICSPTTNRLVPRHERTPKIYSQPPSTPLPLPPLPPPPAYLSSRGSLGSTSTFAPSTKSTVSTGGGISFSSLRNETVSLLSLPPPPPPPPPPQSPTRPPRPHEAPLYIPDLVSPASPTASVASPSTVSTPTSPAGPPPNRALPRTPVIVVDGASPSASPELGGWVGRKIRGREKGGQGMSLELDLGSKRG